MATTAYNDLLESFKKREESARLSNLSRKEQVESIYTDIIKRYEPGGGFGAGYESLLKRQKVHDVGATAQRDISRGLHGIRPYEAEWEATTGATGRLKLEDIRMERLSGAQTGMASFLERIDEPYPDYSSLLAASQAQGQSAGSGTSSSGGDSGGDYMDNLFGANRFGGGSRPGPTAKPYQGTWSANDPGRYGATTTSTPQGSPLDYATLTGAAGGGGVTIGENIGTRPDFLKNVDTAIQGIDADYTRALDSQQKDRNLSPKGMAFDAWLSATGRGPSFSSVMKWKKANKG